MGNHEDMMLAALIAGDPGSREDWLSNGGGDTLRSWGLSAHGTAADWRQGLPARHFELLRGLRLMHRCGGYAFVHAGIHPGRPLDRQSRNDLLWIREPFLSWNGPLPKVIVHGHTPAPSPEVRRCRIGIDTGAVRGGPLTCAVLEADRIGFLEA